MINPKTGNPKSGKPLGEFGRIDRFFKPLASGFPGARGLADDAAVFGIPPDQELVVTTDAMVAGVHFFPDDSPGDIAAKLLRTNLSDLAAMGAVPYAYTLVTALPKTVGEDWLGAFAAGLGEDQARFGIALAGGDSVSTSGPVTLSVTAFGLVPKGKAVPRWGGRPGDRLFVTGTIGDAALGLQIAFGKLEVTDDSARAVLLRRLRYPDPRTTLGPRLVGLATGCLDVSDGLVADLGHLCEESGCAAILESARVPLSDAARAVVGSDPARFALALTGGDDYELLFAAPAEAAPALAALSVETGVPVTAIGRLVEGPAGSVVVTDPQGRALDLPTRGWDHF
ncbi:thiamine-phosphate kinase [Roseomonas genomospecies 6]|uniref:Thiamine-monophosphate kinase n=1 Tax=Roseomonas genomospecies 6 TaxID=214106 RepID=A0A9W7NKM4_9PROT|nr:thiamine-phosphate kinase [Roseomonas genomospecies 6]KAA0681484.1 thiamine-phosphate kinase [Roseomonas genomospecies 6]